MKLLATPTSPFARKARILILEKGLACETVAAAPWDDDPQVLAANPLRKIPVLLPDDGGAVFDSRVICERLDAEGEPRFIPSDPAARAAVKTQEALADGAAESVAAIVMAKRVDPEMASAAWEQWLLDKARNAFARFAEEMKARPRPADAAIHLGDVALFCALDFALFRRPDLEWRESHPELGEWFERFGERESARKTDPRG